MTFSSTYGERETGRSSTLLTKQGLMRIKTKAMRSGVWFRLLSRADRAILNLTIRCVEKVRSRVLAKSISEIISRVLKTLEDSFMNKAQKFGREIVVRVSGTAQMWGNKNARTWKHDRSFIEFLGVNALNT